MCCFIADTILLVSIHIAIIAQRKRSGCSQLPHPHGSWGRLVSRLHLYGSGHHFIRQNHLCHCTLSVCRSHRFLLPWHHSKLFQFISSALCTITVFVFPKLASRCIRWGSAFFHASLGATA